MTKKHSQIMGMTIELAQDLVAVAAMNRATLREIQKLAAQAECRSA